MITVQVDTREHKSEWERIQKQFDELGVKYFRSKLFCGDYQSLDNARLVIDRKKDLQEIYGNICQQHERFKSELLRAIDSGIKIVILCEHGEDVQSLEDVYFFYQPSMQRWKWEVQKGPDGDALVDSEGKPMKRRIPYTQKAIDGKKIYRSLCTIRDRYNVDFVFCTKEQTGTKIVEILSNDSRGD